MAVPELPKLETRVRSPQAAPLICVPQVRASNADARTWIYRTKGDGTNRSDCIENIRKEAEVIPPQRSVGNFGPRKGSIIRRESDSSLKELEAVG